jgi:hypothetical protein
MFYIELGERQENLRGEPLAFSNKEMEENDRRVNIYFIYTIKLTFFISQKKKKRFFYYYIFSGF